MPCSGEPSDAANEGKRAYKKPTKIEIRVNRKNFFKALQRDYSNGKWLEIRLIYIGRRAGFNRSELEEIIGNFWLELWRRGFNSFDGRISSDFDFSKHTEDRNYLFNYLARWFLNRGKDYRSKENRRMCEIIETNLDNSLFEDDYGGYDVGSYGDRFGMPTEAAETPLIASET